MFEPLDFPAVTFCNLNNIRGSKINLGGDQLVGVITNIKAEQDYARTGTSVKRTKRQTKTIHNKVILTEISSPNAKSPSDNSKLQLKIHLNDFESLNSSKSHIISKLQNKEATLPKSGVRFDNMVNGSESKTRTSFPPTASTVHHTQATPMKLLERYKRYHTYDYTYEYLPPYADEYNTYASYYYLYK